MAGQRAKLGFRGKTALTGIAWATLIGSGVSQAAAYDTPINLGAGSGLPDSVATSINNQGVVTISSIDPGEGDALYRGGVYTAIPAFSTGTNTLQQVNDAGITVGTTGSSPNTQAVYTVGNSGTVTPLTSDPNSVAQGVSPSVTLSTAIIVGSKEVNNSNGINQATSWTGTGTSTPHETDLIGSGAGLFDPTEPSQANAVNLAGTIVGQATKFLPGDQADETPDAFVRSNLGGLTDIAPSGSTESNAEAINAAGTVVGSFQTVDNTLGVTNQSGFVYSPVTGITVLGDLGGPSLFSDAQAINTLGQIVGESMLPDGSAQVAVIYGPTGIAQNLNDDLPANSGWVLTDATGINDAGDIVGFGYYDNSPDQSAFLLEPATSVPEPSTLASLAAAACVFAARLKFRQRREA